MYFNQSSNSKDYIKNISPEDVFEASGNTGTSFPYKSRQIPGKFDSSCILSLEENREFSIITEDGQQLYIFCPAGF